MPTYQDAILYLMVFTSITLFKGFCSGVHRYKLNQVPLTRYETESTLATVMKIQMQFNFLLLHGSLFLRHFDNLTVQQSGKLDILIIASTCLYAIVLILTDYRWLLKIYRYENHLLRVDYPLIEFLAIQVFMMFGCALLIAIQWFMIPIVSDLMYQLLCVYHIPSIIKCHQNNQKPNLTYFCFLEDYCILLLFSYYRGCPFNIFKLGDNMGICISIAIFIFFQQCVLLYQYHVKPKLYQVKTHVEEFASQIREQRIYSQLDDISISNLECAICLQGVDAPSTLQIQLHPQDPIVYTLCSHKFHESCLLVWLRVKKQCPVCRHQF